ncbi:hypothetical protein MES5069_200081 [Mesorhizobium escarrei]|uniref:Uncharacterized protein n=1 Tax=Mesorhizobium escarrei TaxID=666018 RepID=A0ABM9DPL8_9HYPH|nr:hypothetical protein MES5069_200081 [Mesorhizobium escarrei]
MLGFVNAEQFAYPMAAGLQRLGRRVLPARASISVRHA